MKIASNTSSVYWHLCLVATSLVGLCAILKTSSAHTIGSAVSPTTQLGSSSTRASSTKPTPASLASTSASAFNLNAVISKPANCSQHIEILEECSVSQGYSFLLSDFAWPKDQASLQSSCKRNQDAIKCFRIYIRCLTKVQKVVASAVLGTRAKFVKQVCSTSSSTQAQQNNELSRAVLEASKCLYKHRVNSLKEAEKKAIMSAEAILTNGETFKNITGDLQVQHACCAIAAIRREFLEALKPECVEHTDVMTQFVDSNMGDASGTFCPDLESPKVLENCRKLERFPESAPKSKFYIMPILQLSSGHSQSRRHLNEDREHNDRLGECLKHITSWPEYIKKSFTAKMNDAKSKSDTNLELAVEIVCAFASTTTWMLCLLGTIIVPILLFFIGLVNLDDCPSQPGLPKLVFTIGFVMVSSNLFNLAIGFDLPILRNHVNLTTEAKDIVASVVNIIFNCIVVFIFILITFYLYGMHPSTTSASTMAQTIQASDESENNTGTRPSTANGTTQISSSSSPSIDLAINDLRNDTAASQQHGVDNQNLYCDPLLYSFTYWFITLSLLFMVIMTLIGIASSVYNRYKKALIKGSTPRVYETQNTFQVES